MNGIMIIMIQYHSINDIRMTGNCSHLLVHVVILYYIYYNYFFIVMNISK
jgi:hypothetical protein